MKFESSQSFSKEQLIQAFQRAKPNIAVSEPIQPNDLFAALNAMSQSVSNLNQDQNTVEELIEKVQQAGKALTISNYLDVHILAVEVLNLRLKQQQENKLVFAQFLANLQNRIHELNSNPKSLQPTQGFSIAFKQLSIKETIQKNNLKIRLFNDKQGIDQTLPFVNSNGFQSIILENSQAALDSLDQHFQIEVFDDQTNYGFTNLEIYQMNITYPKTLSVPLVIDSLPTNYTLNIDGFVSIDNLQYAQEDLAILQDKYASYDNEILDTQEQLTELNGPFVGFKRPNQQQYQSQIQSQMQQQHQQHSYNGAAPPENNAIQNSQSQKQQSSGSSGNVSVQTLVDNIHYLLIGYLFTAIFFCLKRQMFLDVSISVAFLYVLYKFDFQRDIQKTALMLKIFSGLFAFSGCMDIAWFIVFFSSWNRSETSEDQGAQGIIRPIIIICSLLFFVYKLIVIVAVFLFQSSIAGHGQKVRKNIYSSLDESKAAPIKNNNQAVAQQPAFQGQSSVVQMH